MQRLTARCRRDCWCQGRCSSDRAGMAGCAAADIVRNSKDAKPDKSPDTNDDDDADSGGGIAAQVKVLGADIVKLLNARGGRIQTGQRGLGRLIGLERTRVNERCFMRLLIRAA